MGTNRKGARGQGQNLTEIRRGYWKVVVNIPAGQSPDGKRHRRVSYVHGGVRMAEAKRRELLGERDQGRLKPRVSGTVAEYLDAWLKSRRSSVAPRTAQRWEGLIEKQIKPHLGSLLLRDLRPKDLRTMYTDLQEGGLSGTTVHKVHALLSMVLKRAVIDGDLATNPCIAVDAPRKDTKPASTLDEAQVADLLKQVADGAIYVPLLVTLDGGLRRGELLALKWEDLQDGAITVRGSVEESSGLLRIAGTKTGRVRHVRLTKRALQALESHRRAQAALRLGSQARRRSQPRALEMIRIGLDVSEKNRLQGYAGEVEGSPSFTGVGPGSVGRLAVEPHRDDLRVRLRLPATRRLTHSARL